MLQTSHLSFNRCFGSRDDFTVLRECDFCSFAVHGLFSACNDCASSSEATPIAMNRFLKRNFRISFIKSTWMIMCRIFFIHFRKWLILFVDQRWKFAFVNSSNMCKKIRSFGEFMLTYRAIFSGIYSFLSIINPNSTFRFLFQTYYCFHMFMFWSYKPGKFSREDRKPFSYLSAWCASMLLIFDDGWAVFRCCCHRQLLHSLAHRYHC